MTEANQRSEIIRRIAVGEKLVLVSEEPTGVWYRVLDPKTNSEGWLNGNHFKIIKARKNNKKAVRSRKAVFEGISLPLRQTYAFGFKIGKIFFERKF